MRSQHLSPVPTPVLAIRPLTAADDAGFATLVTAMHTHLTSADFAARLAEMRAQGYRAVGLFIDGEMVAVSGYWVMTRFYVGRTLVIDNLVVAAARRSQRLGQRLLDWLEAEARAENCQAIVLDAYSHNLDAHRFYIRNRFDIIGYHFFKRLASHPLSPDAA
jgi:ribosomal protein S18 acetylase RimI-like enzyme